MACGNLFNRYWWVQDGAPVHMTLNVKERLLEIFKNRIIALGHKLTPCDYFLWGHMKNQCR